MPTDPSISPPTGGAPSYSIANSRAFIAGFALSISDGNPEDDSFNVLYPTDLGTPVATLTHLRPNGVRVDVPFEVKTQIILVPVDPNDNGPDSPRYTLDITATPGVGPGGLSSQLQVSISIPTTGIVNDPWEFRIETPGAGTWTLGVTNAGRVNLGWAACMPVADLSVHASAFEQEQVKLDAADAKPADVNSAVVVGTPPVQFTATYHWTYVGATPLTEMPADGQHSSITPPGVYEPIDVQLTLSTALVEPTGNYSGFLTNTSDPDTGKLRVQPRPQEVVLIVDRSGSMALENRYENAKIASRMLVHLFNGLRAGSNQPDRVAIVAFEDAAPDFHGGDRSPLITQLLPLSPLDVAVASIQNLDFGGPGTNTPIGDGLLTAIDLLAAAGPVGNRRFSLVMLTDGEENCGTTALNPAKIGTTGAVSLATALGGPNSARSKVLANASLFAVALGPTADSDTLRTFLPNVHEVGLAIDPTELVKVFGHMLEAAQTVIDLPTSDVQPVESKFPPVANAVYFSTSATDDRLVLAVIPQAGTLTLPDGDTIRLSRFIDHTDDPNDPTLHTYQPVPEAQVLKSVSDRSTAVAARFGNRSVQWRLTYGPDPDNDPQPIAPTRVLPYADLHLLADVVLDRPAYGTGDRITVTVRIRQDQDPVLGATIHAVLTAPDAGLGEELAALGNAPTQPPASGATDVLTWRERRIGTLLAKRGWHRMPVSQPTNVFIDGTDLLLDPDGDGNYSNVFAGTFKEGAYTWQISVDGLDVDGNPFSRHLAVTAFVSVKVDPRVTKVSATRIRNHPSGLLAADVLITPQDRRHERLGPGHDADVIWALRDGTFEHVANHQPAPVRTDGVYERVVLFDQHQHPKLLVKAAGVVLPEIDVRLALLGL